MEELKISIVFTLILSLFAIGYLLIRFGISFKSHLIMMTINLYDSVILNITDHTKINPKLEFFILEKDNRAFTLNQILRIYTYSIQQILNSKNNTKAFYKFVSLQINASNIIKTLYSIAILLIILSNDYGLIFYSILSAVILFIISFLILVIIKINNNKTINNIQYLTIDQKRFINQFYWYIPLHSLSLIEGLLERLKWLLKN